MQSNLDYVKELANDIVDLNYRIKAIDHMRDEMMFWKHIIQEEIYKIQDKEMAAMK